jgi:hypothetical protein
MLIKMFFYLIISYLRIKSYNVLNYNNCSTDWSFPLILLSSIAFTLNLFLVIFHNSNFHWSESQIISYLDFCQLVLLESVLKNKRPKMIIFLFYREGVIIIGVQQYFSYIAVVNFIVGQSGVPVENLQVNDTPYHISCMKWKNEIILHYIIVYPRMQIHL